MVLLILFSSAVNAWAVDSRDANVSVIENALGFQALLPTSTRNELFLGAKPYYFSPFEPLPLKISLNDRKLKGWSYIANRLIEGGASPQIVSELLSDFRMPKNAPIFFSLAPREPRNLYRGHNTERTRLNALRFYKKNFYYFFRASYEFQVPESVILAILQVETNCGSFTGKARVLPSLLRLADAASPDNVFRNFKRAQSARSSATLEQVSQRAKWLEETFLPHAIALIELAEQRAIHPLEIRGSGSGALGMPQFLPGHHFAYGVDGNSDEAIDLFSAPDAIFSVANYLNQHGWTKLDLDTPSKHAVIWHYNHSEPYIETVLALSDSLNSGIEKIKTSIKNELIVQSVQAPIGQIVPIGLVQPQ